jgi:predicted nicotinamide N-methyase
VSTDVKRIAVDVRGLAFELETIADLDRAAEAAVSPAPDTPPDAARVFPYFGVLWPAALGVAQHLAERTDLRGATMLEIGCGLALPSLVAARLGAKVVATDLHADVPRFLARNLERNAIAPDAVAYRALDWREPHPDLGAFDVVAGSDLLYERGQADGVAARLAEHCAPRGSIVLGDPGREYLQPCVDALERRGFRSEVRVLEVPDAYADRAGDRKTSEVFVVVFRRR